MNTGISRHFCIDIAAICRLVIHPSVRTSKAEISSIDKFRPAIPFKTLSDPLGAARGAGKAWVHAHSLAFPGHNGLIENENIGPGRFKVNLGPYGSCDVVKTVKEMMLWDWGAGCPKK